MGRIRWVGGVVGEGWVRRDAWCLDPPLVLLFDS